MKKSSFCRPKTNFIPAWINSWENSYSFPFQPNRFGRTDYSFGRDSSRRQTSYSSTVNSNTPTRSFLRQPPPPPHPEQLSPSGRQAKLPSPQAPALGIHSRDGSPAGPTQVQSGQGKTKGWLIVKLPQITSLRAGGAMCKGDVGRSRLTFGWFSC